jgi:hypothetical protein
MRQFAFAILLVVGLAHAGEQPDRKLALHVVSTPIKSYRLLAMSMDEDGFIWAGAIHNVVHRYDPRTDKVVDVTIPYRATASSCICAGKKVYILGQTYPKLIIYDRTMKKFSEVGYPSSKPDVWYGTEASVWHRGQLGSVASDVLGVSGREMLRSMIAGVDSAEALANLARGPPAGQAAPVTQGVAGAGNGTSSVPAGDAPGSPDAPGEVDRPARSAHQRGDGEGRSPGAARAKGIRGLP